MILKEDVTLHYVLHINKSKEVNTTLVYILLWDPIHKKYSEIMHLLTKLSHAGTAMVAGVKYMLVVMTARRRDSVTSNNIRQM